MNDDKRCGTCGWSVMRHHDPTDESETRLQCLWDWPLPYATYEFHKHLVVPEDGALCPCWKRREKL